MRLGIIFGIVFLDLLGFGIVIPILPYYAKQFGASAWALGWLMTVYSLMQFLIAPVWGRLSDRVGRRPVLLISLLGSALSLTFLGFAHSLTWLFVGRTFAGICGANISTAYAYVADVTTEKDRAKGMGIIGAGFGLGFIFGPAIGGLLSPHGLSIPMFFAAGLSLINLVFAYFKLEEPALSPETRAAHRTKRFDPNVIRGVLSVPIARLAVTLFFLVTFAVTQMEVVFGLYMLNRFGYDARAAGVLLAIMGVVMVSVQGGAIGRLSRRFGEPRLVQVGLTLCIVGLLGFSWAGSVPRFVIALCVLALGHGMLHPSLSSLASKGAGPTERGATMGVFQSAGSLARVVGPPCAGFLFDRVSPIAPFLVGAAVLGVAGVIAVVRRQAAVFGAGPPPEFS